MDKSGETTKSISPELFDAYKNFPNKINLSIHNSSNSISSIHQWAKNDNPEKYWHIITKHYVKKIDNPNIIQLITF